MGSEKVVETPAEINENEGGTGERVNARLVDIGNNDPNYDSKFTLNAKS